MLRITIALFLLLSCGLAQSEPHDLRLLVDVKEKKYANKKHGWDPLQGPPDIMVCIRDGKYILKRDPWCFVSQNDGKVNIRTIKASNYTFNKVKLLRFPIRDAGKCHNSFSCYYPRITANSDDFYVDVWDLDVGRTDKVGTAHCTHGYFCTCSDRLNNITLTSIVHKDEHLRPQYSCDDPSKDKVYTNEEQFIIYSLAYSNHGFFRYLTLDQVESCMSNDKSASIKQCVIYEFMKVSDAKHNVGNPSNICESSFRHLATHDFGNDQIIGRALFKEMLNSKTIVGFSGAPKVAKDLIKSGAKVAASELSKKYRKKKVVPVTVTVTLQYKDYWTNTLLDKVFGCSIK